MNKTDKKIYLVLLFIATIFVLFFGFRKMDYHVDEIWTFGLANHIGGINPTIEYGKTYTGEGFFKDFMEVGSGKTFNYANVLENQANDVHPPLYYFLIHTVCSIFKNSYSMWYGIAVNIFWMVLIILMLYKLVKELTNDTLKTFGFMLIYITSTAFIDTILLIRMYAQFTFFAISISYLIFKYWNKKLDKAFYILYSATIILGMLSHYYFLIFAFFISAAYGIHLILDKRLIELRNCIITAAIDGAIYLILWHHIINHIFRGGRGREALQSAASIDFSAIGFVILTIIAFIIIFKRGREKYSYTTALFVSGLFYSLVVLKIAPFRTFRYWMPIVFIGFYIAYSCIDYLLSKLMKNNVRKGMIIALLLLVNIISLAGNGFHTSMDFYNKEYSKMLSDIEGKDYIIYIEEDWEALYYYVPTQKANSYVFINPDTIDLLENVQDGVIFSTSSDHLDKVKDLIKGKPLYSSGLQYFEITN